MIFNQIAVNIHVARHVEEMTKTWNVCRIQHVKSINQKIHDSVMYVVLRLKRCSQKYYQHFVQNHVVDRNRGITHHKQMGGLFMKA